MRASVEPSVTWTGPNNPKQPQKLQEQHSGNSNKHNHDSDNGHFSTDTTLVQDLEEWRIKRGYFVCLVVVHDGMPWNQSDMKPFSYSDIGSCHDTRETQRTSNKNLPAFLQGAGGASGRTVEPSCHRKQGAGTVV